MKFEVRNRWSGEVQFTADIEADENTYWRVKIGLALKWAVANKIVLRDADLRDAVLRDADLRDAVLRGAVLRGADLRDAVLRDADLRGADLRGADLRDADLRDAVLRDADLRDAVLRDADLRGADLRGAVLRGADLRDAVLSGFKIIRVLARAVRNDGYEFIGFETDKGLLIRAGCRTMLIGDYRQHITREYPDCDKATETSDILDFIELRAKKLGYAEPVAIAA